MKQHFSRRDFLAGTVSAAGAMASAASLRAQESESAADDEAVTFFLVGDTHFLADRDDTARMEPRSALVTSRLVDRLNALAGSEIPEVAGGGQVLKPRGVIHAGDCIDTGDKADVKMQATEWAAFAETFGLSGKEGRLKLPVYEVHGNHDSPRGDGLAVKQMIARNPRRPGVKNVSPGGVHYSWDWGNVHFVNLGIVVGQDKGVMRKRRYAPLDSLDFLVSDLQEHVGNSGRPVVCTHHVDMLRYAQPLPVEDKQAEGMEWDPADVRSYHQALAGYNVAAILYGHTHARNIFRWDGSNKKAESGIPAFNVDNSSHFGSPNQAFYYFELRSDRLLVREFFTTDSWETGTWTPQTWSVEIPAARA
jgi:predicted phosphodiesterase